MKSKIVFITASSGGIGFGLAKRYLGKNYKVIINGKNKKKLIRASERLKKCDYILGDMTNIEIIKKVIDIIKKKYKSVDILIANLGNSDFKKNNKNFDHSLKYNLLSTINLVENSKKTLKSKSKVICISSICGSEVIKGAPIGYSVSKAALNFYIKSISRELAKKNISINGILPGNIMFKGSTWEKKIKNDKTKTKKYIRENVPTNSFGNLDDIFNACLMISESSSYINGSLLKIDGSQTLSV